MNLNAKIIQKILSPTNTQIQQHIEVLLYTMTKWDLSKEYKSCLTQINACNIINNTRKTKHAKLHVYLS